MPVARKERIRHECLRLGLGGAFLYNGKVQHLGVCCTLNCLWVPHYFALEKYLTTVPNVI